MPFRFGSSQCLWNLVQNFPLRYSSSLLLCSFLIHFYWDYDECNWMNEWTFINLARGGVAKVGAGYENKFRYLRRWRRVILTVRSWGWRIIFKNSDSDSVELTNRIAWGCWRKKFKTAFSNDSVQDSIEFAALKFGTSGERDKDFLLNRNCGKIQPM